MRSAASARRSTGTRRREGCTRGSRRRLRLRAAARPRAAATPAGACRPRRGTTPTPPRAASAVRRPTGGRSRWRSRAWPRSYVPLPSATLGAWSGPRPSTTGAPASPARCATRGAPRPRRTRCASSPARSPTPTWSARTSSAGSRSWSGAGATWSSRRSCRTPRRRPTAARSCASGARWRPSSSRSSSTTTCSATRCRTCTPTSSPATPTTRGRAGPSRFPIPTRRRCPRSGSCATSTPCAAPSPERGTSAWFTPEGRSALLDGRVLGHELALAAVRGDAHDDDAAGLEADHDAVAEGRVDDVVAHAVLGARRVGLRVGPRHRSRADVLRRGHGADGLQGALAVGEVGRDLAQKAAGQPVVLRAEHGASAGEGQVEVAHGARDPDVAEPALFLERALVERARVREDALLAADHEDDRVLEALRIVQRHERHEALVVAARVGVGHQRDLLQEEVEGVVLGAGVELARDLDQLLEVLDASLSLDRALGLECVQVAGLVQDRVEQVADRDLLLGALAQEGHGGHEALEGPHRRRAQTGHLARRSRGVPDRDAHRLGVVEHARQRRLADPAPRRVGNARERHHVLRVGEPGQVGDRVLDLGALVELRPADDLVADLPAHERVLEDARLRVGPVEDRDLRARDALVHEALDLPHHEARLGVLVLELAHLDRIALAEVGPQRLAHPPAVVRDDRVGDAEDRLRRAVVLLEPYDLGVGVVVAEREDISDIRAAEAVD